MRMAGVADPTATVLPRQVDTYDTRREEMLLRVKKKLLGRVLPSQA